MSTAAHHAAHIDWWAIIIWGWIILSFVGEWVADRYNMGLRALRRRRLDKRKHALKMKRLELQIARERREDQDTAQYGVPLRPALTRKEEKAAGPCPHRPKNVKPVFDALGDHRAFLCTACDTQLPKDWAVLEDDL